jgi:PAS domain S-box-containing protein
MASAVPFQGSPAALICFCDISSRKEAEERFRALFNRAPESMFIYSLADRKFLEVNEAFCIQLGYTREELLQQNPVRIFATRNGAGILKKIHSGKRKRKMILETDYYRKDGTMFPAELSLQRIDYENIDCVFAISRDVTSRRKHEQLLERSREQYRELSIHLQNVREEQNALIAREIHDELGQSLTALKMHLSLLEKQKVEANSNQRQELFADMKLILDDTIQRVRKLSRDLWPSQLDISGVIEALEVQVTEFRHYSELEIVFNPPKEEISLPKDKSLAVYRIVQEALTNVIRHASASLVTIDVFLNSGVLHVIIKDDGTGIRTRKRDKKMAFGILSMKERAAMFKGSLTISGSRGMGTSLHLKMPISR